MNLNQVARFSVYCGSICLLLKFGNPNFFYTACSKVREIGKGINNPLIICCGIQKITTP